MSGRKKSLLRRKLGIAPLPVAAMAALVSGSLTLMIWQSPRNIVADVKPLIMEFGSSKIQFSSDFQSESANGSAETETAGSGTSAGGSSGPSRRSLEPVRTERSNGGLVLEWPQRNSTQSAETSNAKTQAKKVLTEAQDFLLAGDLRRALISARLAYSYPVEWQPGEQNPEELLAKLEALASDPTFVASARRQATSQINSANTSYQSGASSIVDSVSDRQTAIGVWKPAVGGEVGVSSTGSNSGNVALATQSQDATSIETASASEIAERQSANYPAYQPYQSQQSNVTATDDEPRRLNIDTHRQISESTAEFMAPAQFAPINQFDPRPLIITDQRTAAAPAASPIGTLTFDVLATLTTIFAVLFFGALFLFLAILAVGKKLIGDKGVAFRIELVNNSPLTIQAGGVAPAAAPVEAVAPATATDELKIDPDFEGILSLSEQRARQREAAILEQFIENNVSLHNEIGASRAAA
jgi:hypothetical protein